MSTMTWTKGMDIKSGYERVDMACTAAGDSFVIWGGDYETATPPAFGEPAIYNLRIGNWTDEFSPLVVSGPLPVPSSPPTPDSSTPSSPESSKGINGAAIGGGLAAAILLIAIVFFMYRRRKSKHALHAITAPFIPSPRAPAPWSSERNPQLPPLAARNPQIPPPEALYTQSPSSTGRNPHINIQGSTTNTGPVVDNASSYPYPNDNSLGYHQDHPTPPDHSAQSLPEPANHQQEAQLEQQIAFLKAQQEQQIVALEAQQAEYESQLKLLESQLKT
ncbi:hypothetical protein BGZ51_007774 [Haplosporangium sp. Z 767]|nr:hypothetical protein BGZ51_007774 [Haplosporangium sp. Z 767]